MSRVTSSGGRLKARLDADIRRWSDLRDLQTEHDGSTRRNSYVRRSSQCDGPHCAPVRTPLTVHSNGVTVDVDDMAYEQYTLRTAPDTAERSARVVRR